MKRSKKPADIRHKRVAFWTKRIDSLLGDRNRQWAKDSLEGIKKTIQDTNNVTDKQIEAIKNIQNGKNQGRMRFG